MRLLEQAQADCRCALSNSPELLECHRRYLMQQTVEKAFKAIMVAAHTKALRSIADEVLSHNPMSMRTEAANAARSVIAANTQEEHIVVLQEIDRTLQSRPDKKTMVSSGQNVRYPSLLSKSGKWIGPITHRWFPVRGTSESDCRKIVAGLVSTASEVVKGQAWRP